MAQKGELAKDLNELIMPTVEITRIDVEDCGDVASDVDGDVLGMELQKGDGFVNKHGGAETGGRR